jgi:predicted nuclease of predicted toxin-antitoxin system
VRLARRRGFHAVHVNKVNLRTAGDKRIARYAVGSGMILVTNNVGDFTRLYQRRLLHPGLIFLRCNLKGTFTDRSQATMLSAALDDLLQNELVQEAIAVSLLEDTGKDFISKLIRYRLPKD